MSETTVIGFPLPDEAQFRRDIQAINKFQKVAHSELIPNLDYGVIPGTTKPTLLKPGAEKIAKLLGLSDTYEMLDRQEDWARPFFRYLIRCSLSQFGSDKIVSQGLGECNSMEGKYRWRDSKRKCLLCNAEAIIKGKEEWGGGWVCFKKQGGCGAKFNDGDERIEGQKIGRVENEDIYSQVNTILKMAKKRALVDAALSAGRLSDIFTQDMEDMPIEVIEGKATVVTEEPPAKQKAATIDKPTKATTAVPPRDPASIKTIMEMFRACFDDFGLTSKQTLEALAVRTQQDIALKPADCYIAVRDKVKLAKEG